MSDNIVPDDFNLGGDDQQDGEAAVLTTEETPSAQRAAEELEWSQLRGNAQERFQQLIRERNAERQARLEAEQRIQEVSTKLPPPPRTDEGITPEEEAALNRIKNRFGIVTKEELESLKAEIASLEAEKEDNRYVQEEYDRLQEIYDGSNGLPRFSVEEVEDYMRRTGIYNPEKAFQDMYDDEFFDYRVKQRRGEGLRSSYTNRPTVGSPSGREEPLSRESLQEKLNSPKGREWWEKNRDKVLPVLGQISSDS